MKPGLYEQLINEKLNAVLSERRDWQIERSPLDDDEIRRLVHYAADVIDRSLRQLHGGRATLAERINLINRLVGALGEDQGLALPCETEQLLGLAPKCDSLLAISREHAFIRPETSIAHGSLFTGSRDEPSLEGEFIREIHSADRIDMLVSFIKWSGLRLMLDALRAFAARGGRLRIITTSYLGATDVKALDCLLELPHTEIRVSYDTKRTRLHAKTYVFHRDSGFTTAYVGSSNMSAPAMTSGLEWNMKLSVREQPETFEKIAATFESYWNDAEFAPYGEAERGRFIRAVLAERHHRSAELPFTFFTIRPYHFQQEILEKLQSERIRHGRCRNLVVAATGTGKTIISAFDYKQFHDGRLPEKPRLLFVAHREEILRQSLNTFRMILKDENFGDLMAGQHQPAQADHLFASIQTINARQLWQVFSADYFDYIVVDEFHHAAAPSYRRLLEHFKPKILLGLTATPERMDGQSILGYFDHRIAAEIRLAEAIERKLLSPFHYFGVADPTSLESLSWTRGGYDRNELSTIYTMSGLAAEKRAALIIASVRKYVADISDVRGIGFCVSVEHAAFMAARFNAAGIPSMCLHGGSPRDLRQSAQPRLNTGEITFIFVVDIYNEGVDLPEVNTVLFLRPTESLTVFLQQLGRGLRLAEGKDCLTVLDFIGQANRHYRFEEKFDALLSKTRSGGLKKEIDKGFPSVPRGSFIQLEKTAQEHILRNIRRAYSQRQMLISLIGSFEMDSGQTLSLCAFLHFHHLDLPAVYRHASFSRLSADAGVLPDFETPIEATATKAFAKLALLDSERFITFLLDLVQHGLRAMSVAERRMFRMFWLTVKPNDDGSDWFREAADFLHALRSVLPLRSECLDILKIRYDRIDFVDEPLAGDLDLPLDVYASYSRDQLFAALDVPKPASIREGVKHLPDKKLDVLLVTLHKSEDDYTPTTMYRDYSINERLFHWQSQSTTSAESETGRRYIEHGRRGYRVLLFVRDFKVDQASGLASPYTFLGTANYVRHEGSRPMSIVWKLDRPIPARFLKKTNRLVVG